MPIDINQQLRHLPFKTVQELTYYLEPPSDTKDWLSLVRVMPEGRFSQRQVDMMRINGSKPNNTCTEVLWRELSHLCVTVKELGFYLKKIKNYDALAALDWPHEPVEITCHPSGSRMVLQEGQALRLQVTAIGFPLPGYQWYKNDEIIRGEEICELNIIGVSPSDSGKYKCIASNGESTSISSEANVLVMRKGQQQVPDKGDLDANLDNDPMKNGQPSLHSNKKPVVITHPRSQHVLVGTHCVLLCEALGEEPMTYVWYKDGEPLLNSNKPELHLRLFGQQDIGSYACEVTNSYGNDISNVAEVMVGQIGRELRNEATDKVALLIGNQDYTANFPEGSHGQGVLRHTIADTKTLGSLLHREDMGFNVLSFANLSLSEMKKAVEEFISLLSGDCYVVFYFAGHGFELNGKHYLVPVDAPLNWLQEDCICIQWVLEEIWNSRPKLTTILLDMCRIRPTNVPKATFEEYDFPHDLKIVIGFATCSQSESYERVDEDNGIYMKYLKRHLCRDVKIEDILHDVNTEVEAETSRCEYTDRQRPEYVTKGGGYFSLRDPVQPRGNTSAEKWLEAHKLPRRRILQFEQGVKVEVRFEHSNWLTNAMNICVGIVDPGTTDHSFAYIYQLPNAEHHFMPDSQTAVKNPVPREPLDERFNARSWPQPSAQPPAVDSERSTEIFHLQRLYGNLPITIALVSDIGGTRTTKYKVEVFAANEFGLAQVFQNID